MMTSMDLSNLKEISRRQQEEKEMGYVVIRDLPRQEKIHKMQKDKSFRKNIEKANDEIGQRVGKNDVADWSKRELKPVLGTLEDYEKQEAGKLRKIYSNPIFNRISDRELLEYVKLEKHLKEKEVKTIFVEPVKECKSCGAFDYEFKNDNYHCSYCGRRFIDDSK